MCVLLLIGTVSASARPDQKLTIQIHKGTLSEFFKEIEKQSDYRFFYNDEMVNIEKEIHLMDVKNKSIDDVLATLLANTELRYRKLDNNLIIISSKELLQSVGVSGTVLDAAGEAIPGVNVSVKGTTIGTITDANGHFSLEVPSNNAVLLFSFIGYASQEVKVGTQRTLQIVLQEDNLLLEEVVVVAYGTAKKKDLTGSISTVDTKLLVSQSNSSVSSALEGAVAGLQVQKLEGQPGLDMAIRVRGLGSTNENAANALIVIDGVPQEKTNILSSINPNDIASMTILKDAASTALYGSRGANGVVLITTKKGISGKAKVSFDARWGVNTMTNNMPDLLRDPAQTYEHQWLLNYNTYRYADGKPYQSNNYRLDVQNPMHTHEEAALYASQHLFNYSGNSNNLEVNNLLNWMVYSFPGWNDESNYERIKTGTGKETATMLNSYLVGTDGKLNPQAQLLYNDTFYDLILKDRFRQEYNVSASGGSDRMNYHISMGYLQDPSYIQTSSFDRYVGRAVLNGNVTNWLKVGTNISYSYRVTNAQPSHYSSSNGEIYQGMGDASHNVFSTIMSEPSILQVYAHNPDGSYILNPDGSRKVHQVDGDGKSMIGPTYTDPWGNIPGNIFVKMEQDRQTLKSHYVTTRTYADVKFLNDFTFTANLSVDGSFDNITRYLNNSTAGAAGVGGLNKQNGSSVNLNAQQLLNYSRDFGKHHVDALLGHEFNQYSYEDMIFTTTHSLIPNFPVYGNFVGVYTGNRVGSRAVRFGNPSGNIWQMAMESYLGRANYIFDNKYYASVSLRRDGSSKFKNPDDRWGTFWSVGGGWRISGEEFMKGAEDWLNNLKIRASYGVLGNQAGISTYGTYQTWTLGAIYSATGAGAAQERIPSSFTLSQGARVYENLTWENIHTMDAALEFDLFNRVRGTVDWYNRETVNAFFGNVLSKAAEAFALTTNLTMNNAKIRNRGFDVELNVDLITNKDLYWSVGLNGGHFNTILTEMPAGQGDPTIDGNMLISGELPYLRGEGKPYYNTYVFKYEGPDPDCGVALWSHVVTQVDHDASRFNDTPVGERVKTSNYSIMSNYDRVEMGDAVPDWIGGFNTSVRYKNFDLSASIAYQVGGLVYWRDAIVYYEVDFGRDHPMLIDKEILGNTWTPENPNAKFPIAVMNKNNSWSWGLADLTASSLTMFDASYFSLKNVTLGYTLPKSLTSKAQISNLRIYASADNSLMFSAHKGIDPRMSLTGRTPMYAYPYLRVFNVGLNVEF
ncbi:MAG: TonB-dependent receptor [Tannerella sp.]|nr:TonB-dependent receptor [Tannerella sp.]